MFKKFDPFFCLIMYYILGRLSVLIISLVNCLKLFDISHTKDKYC